MTVACEVTTLWFGDDGVIPNNPRLPVVLLRAALPADAGAAHVRSIHQRNGWGGNWAYTVFDYHHWHPDAHEVLSVSRGAAELMLGGPQGDRLELRAGDTLVLPAGTGHCRLSASADFEVCGAYPPGQEHYTTRRNRPADRRDGPEQIARVPLPDRDPVFGDAGPLTRAWSR
ncbi:cupin domain-containing protein [Paroceanicella profunda]|uniref:Cupin domain-containing protein n=1 Tax=Paroceanicella profunda TaxID=2579971 RepID=A0A5B8FH90_9RHOB|nr:cupin domain-containing protein [Paroceanicella profunda]QDL91907.1 cupin domain-containing protein [Paroceanicella profunda]